MSLYILYEKLYRIVFTANKIYIKSVYDLAQRYENTIYIFTLSNKRFLSLRIFVTKSLRSRKSCAQPIHYANTKNISSEHVPHQSLTEPSTHAETSSSSQFLGQSHRSKPITAPTIKHPRDNKTFPTRIAHLIYICVAEV